MVIDQMIEDKKRKLFEQEERDRRAEERIQRGRQESARARVETKMGSAWEELKPYMQEPVRLNLTTYLFPFRDMGELRLTDMFVKAFSDSGVEATIEVGQGTYCSSIEMALVHARSIWEHAQRQQAQTRANNDQVNLGEAKRKAASHSWKLAFELLDRVVDQSEEVQAAREEIVAAMNEWRAQYDAFSAEVREWVQEFTKVSQRNEEWIASCQAKVSELSEPYRIQRIGVGVMLDQTVQVHKEWIGRSILGEGLNPNRYYDALENGKVIRRAYTVPVYVEEPITVTPSTAPRGTFQLIEVLWPKDNPETAFAVKAQPWADEQVVRAVLQDGLMEAPARPVLPENSVLFSEEVAGIRMAAWEKEVK